MMIRDDFPALDAMVRDMGNADELYRPGNYWQVYFDRFYPILRSEGLAKFRASGQPTYRSMGVSGKPFILEDDLSAFWFSDLPAIKRAILGLLVHTGIYRKLNSRSIGALHDTFVAFENVLFQLALQGDTEWEILRIQDSGEGAPRDLFHPHGHPGVGYTISFLRNFLEYRWAKRFVDFGSVATILEIGGGYGAQAEVLLKLYPSITKYILCDIPPQLYIQERYLEAVFPGKVTGFMETRSLETIDLAATKRILIIAPWQLPRLRSTVDLFWNSASFQEMEPPIVENYARLVTKLGTRYVYLKEDPTGRTVAASKGEPGVIQPVLADDYVRYFSAFDLLCQEDAAHVTCTNPHAVPLFDREVYDQMFFQKKQA
jgi:putative sugar O-methyltransferase